MSIQIVPVSSRQHWKHFLQLPNVLHQHDPNWVPPLQISVKNILNHKNPFFKRAKVQYWLAYQHEKPVARIAGIINEVHNEFHEEKVAFWGYFESIDNTQVAAQLFVALSHWVSGYGITTLRGPVNLSTNYECGMQISAFDTKPFVMTQQNPAYYPHLIESLGFVKVKDLEAWKMDHKTAKLDPRLLERTKKFAQMNAITIRTIRLDQFDQEISAIYHCYNDAWERNWGFVPMPKDEFLFLAKEMKSILMPEFCFIIEVAGEVAGFSIWLPDINQIVIKIRDGKLFPTGLFKLFWYSKVRKVINQGRIIALGVRKKFRHLNLGSLLYNKYFETLPAAGYPISECSWVLEDNEAMRTALQFMNGEVYKHYRLYEKAI